MVCMGALNSNYVRIIKWLQMQLFILGQVYRSVSFFYFSFVAPAAKFGKQLNPVRIRVRI